MRTPLLAVLLSLCLAAPAGAGSPPPSPPIAAPAGETTHSSGYDPVRAFAPLNMPEPVGRYRSGDGAPGPDYWQNRADYVIAARLEPKTKTLSGVETITYTN